MPVKSNRLLLSILSALLLSLAWYWHLTVLIFFGFVPLLFLEDSFAQGTDPRSGIKLLGYSYLSFFLWNILVTWWVVYASFGGACMAFIFNALFMAMVFVIYSNIKKRLGTNQGVWILIPLWIAWEHWHTIWDLSWTWLTVGNVFAFNHNWVQWYEFTGTSGGTLWALVVNILAFKAIKGNPKLKFISKPILKIAAAIFVPLFFSYLIILLHLFEKPEREKTTQVVVVQPNVDPYNVKFYLEYGAQFHNALKLVEGSINHNTSYLVFPETFITDDLNEAFINESEPVRWFRDSLIERFPQLKIITGGNTYVFYNNREDVTATSRKDEQSGKYYDVFNTAILITANRTAVYHKSKLVPGVERMPFPALLRPLEHLAINMGGTMGSLGTQENRTVFEDKENHLGIAPVICYESVYADYVTEYIRKGASFIFIITNDGWWDDTPGYKQHLNYARLRAIENRREIARSANTGVSCFIDTFGNISQATPWWRQAVIKAEMHGNFKITFFSRFGDLISYFSVLITLVILLAALYLRLRNKKAVRNE
jgi:apolipoprotein N-acyltransferase